MAGKTPPQDLETLRGQLAEARAALEKVKAEARAALEQAAIERRELEKKLVRSVEQLQLLFETTKVIPWEADATTWMFTYVGPQAEKLLGFPIARWYEPDFWQERIHPQDRERALEVCKLFSQTGEEYEFEYRMKTATGKTVWIHDVVSVIRKGEVPAKLRGFLIDVTARKKAETARAKSERQLRLIADSLQVLISYVDRDRRYQFNNAAYERWFGLSREELKGRTIWEVHGKEVYDSIRDKVDRALAGEEVTYETDIATRNGGVRRAEAIYLPNIEPSGSVDGFFALVRDITDR